MSKNIWQALFCMQKHLYLNNEHVNAYVISHTAQIHIVVWKFFDRLKAAASETNTTVVQDMNAL